jgi:deoxyribodipyrimidine photo-lyase
MSPLLVSKARTSALDKLSRIDPVEYARSRNHLEGKVTGLSAFLRHGVLSLAEVRDAAVATTRDISRCFKLIQELAWRDYFQRVWQLLGDRIWSDIEPYKTGFDADDYADELPPDIQAGATGIDYIDHFIEQLHSTGYLHNHARMWLAAYVVHGRRVKWQAGARWFLSHLLDGDEASNNLSWQWCASTFSHKPYIFNRENVLKYSGGRFAEHQANDPFDTDYESLSNQLFRQYVSRQPGKRINLCIQAEPHPSISNTDPAKTLVWIHDGMMSPEHPAVALGHAHIYVWDDAHIARLGCTDKRIAFQRSALFCRDLHSQDKPVWQVLLDFARSSRNDTIVTGATPDPRLLKTIEQLRTHLDVQVVNEKPFVEMNGSLDLSRFSRYWARAQPALLK